MPKTVKIAGKVFKKAKGFSKKSEAEKHAKWVKSFIWANGKKKYYVRVVSYKVGKATRYGVYTRQRKK